MTHANETETQPLVLTKGMQIMHKKGGWLAIVDGDTDSHQARVRGHHGSRPANHDVQAKSIRRLRGARALRRRNDLASKSFASE